MKKDCHRKSLMTRIRVKITYVAIKIFSSLFPEYVYTFVLNKDLLFKYPLNTGIGRAMFSGGFEVYELDFVRNLLKLGDTFIDIGANGGSYTLIASMAVGEKGKVYACEPSRRELKLLKENISLNKIKNVDIIESAISSSNGEIEFGIAKDCAMNSILKTGHPSQGDVVWETVKSITLDSLISLREIDNIALVKIDVEGAEKLVFEGARHLLSSQNPPVFLFESFTLAAKSFDYSPTQLFEFLMGFGYNIYYFDPMNNGLLVLVTSKNYDDYRIGHSINNFVAINQQTLMQVPSQH